MPPGSGAEDLKPMQVMRRCELNNILMAVVPTPYLNPEDGNVGIFVVTRPDEIMDDPALKDLVLKLVQNGEEEVPGSIAIRMAMAAHRYAAEFDSELDESE